MEQRLIAYVGDYRIHDGVIEGFQESPGQAEVQISAESGETLSVSFSGVYSIKARDPVGMMLYALAEIETTDPGRRFVFANWDEDDGSFLEIQADDVSVKINGIIAA